MDAAAGSTAAAVAFDVTDGFTLTVRDGRIVAGRTNSDDPEPVRAAFRRLFAEQPALFETGACKGFFAGGPTPGDCVRAVVAGSEARAERRRGAEGDVRLAAAGRGAVLGAVEGRCALRPRPPLRATPS